MNLYKIVWLWVKKKYSRKAPNSTVYLTEKALLFAGSHILDLRFLYFNYKYVDNLGVWLFILTVTGKFFVFLPGICLYFNKVTENMN